MTESVKVVVHGMDGTIVKGSTQDFHPDGRQFRLVLPNGAETVPVEMAELKAVFFVKQLEDTVPRPRPKEFSAGDGNRPNGRPVAVLFRDGELLVGYTHSYNPERQGFFMLPAETEDNNLRVFVVRSAAKTVRLGPAAEEFARAAGGSDPSVAA